MILIQRWHTRRVVILLYVAVKVSGFSNPPLPSQLTRVGDTSLEDDQAIDEYIENLIKTVDSSSESSSENVLDDIEIDIAVEGDVDTDGKAKQTDGADFGRNVNDADIEEGKESEVEVEALLKEHDDNELELAAQSKQTESEDPEALSDSKTANKRQKRRKNLEDEAQEGQAPEEASMVIEEETPLPQRVVGPTRPNALYRFLLNQGLVGHILVMICILITEFITTYIPPLAHLLAFIFSFLSPSDGTEDSRNYRRGPRGPVQKVNEQYAAFVSSDGSSLRGKQRKKQARKADEQAAEQLRRVGSIQDAKFRHVSDDFMKRHGIGPYRNSMESEDLVVFKERNAIVKLPDGEEEEESDVDWVVEALSKEKEEEEITSPIETSLGAGLGSSGATISVGVQFGLSKKTTKRKRRSTLADAATERTPKPKKKLVGPRTSDRDGGGGVFGRIRAAGANSLVSRSLLGAYPGDAVPPSEAGSADGVVALAEKYGYGDWSDDDDGDYGRARGKVKKKRSSRKHMSSGVSFQFGLSSSSDSTRTRTATPKRSPGTRRNGDSTKESVAFNERSEILLGRLSGNLPERKRVEVRPPMEKLNFATEKAKRRRDED